MKVRPPKKHVTTGTCSQCGAAIAVRWNNGVPTKSHRCAKEKPKR